MIVRPCPGAHLGIRPSVPVCRLTVTGRSSALCRWFLDDLADGVWAAPQVPGDAACHRRFREAWIFSPDLVRADLPVAAAFATASIGYARSVSTAVPDLLARDPVWVFLEGVHHGRGQTKDAVLPVWSRDTDGLEDISDNESTTLGVQKALVYTIEHPLFFSLHLVSSSLIPLRIRHGETISHIGAKRERGA